MLYIVFLFLIINTFFGAVPIPNNVTVIILFICWAVGHKKTFIYKKSFNLIFIGLVCSSISCWYYRGQTLLESFQGLFYYYGILFYFFLKYKHFNLITVEKALTVLIFAFDVCYIVQFHLIDYGINFLNIQDWMLNDKEIEGNRLRIMSSGLYNLGIFFGLVKFNKTKKTLYAIMILLGLYVMFLSGFRQLLASTAIVFVFNIYKMRIIFKPKQIAFMAIIGFAVYYIYQLPEVQAKIEGMIYRNEIGASLNNKSYVRVLQLKFYLNDFFHDPIEWFFGGGLPYYKSAYGAWADRNYQVVDWGLLGQSWALGILTVVGFLMFSIKAIRLKVANEYMYISLWYIFLLLSSVTNYEFMRNGNFLVHGIALYIVELAAKEYKNERKNIILNNHPSL
ncbi:MAG: hypothetical protein OSJ56_08250 [Prevotella sp.]|nr:hypothetical protein [Prevotella sp.]